MKMQLVSIKQVILKRLFKRKNNFTPYTNFWFLKIQLHFSIKYIIYTKSTVIFK